MKASDYDVIVAGGGTAGVAAAVAAARSGAQVGVVERHGFLGGTMTAVSLGSLCGYYTVGESGPELVVGGIPAEVHERLCDADGAASEPVRWLRTASIPYDLFTMKLVLDEICTSAGVDLLLHSMIAGVVTDGASVTGLRLLTPHGPRTVGARAVVDATGDAVVAIHAGAGFDVRDEVQAPTAMFRFGGVDTGVAMRIERPELHRYLEKAVEAGLPLPRTAGGMYSVRPGVVHVNITRARWKRSGEAVLSTEALSAAELEGRRQVKLYERAFREFVPGFEAAFVLDSGAALGVRETRRIRGDYTMTGADVLGLARFGDAVARSAWPMEEHGSGRGVDWRWLEPGGWYQVPLRSLLPSGIDRLVVAGRCISADPEAQASVRVTAQCMATGEAAGVLAATAADRNLPVRGVDPSQVRRELADRGALV